MDYSSELISKYDIPGPRYTSYPTALQFDSGYRWKQIEEILTLRKAGNEPLSLYIHIPFCQNVCYYCACNKIVTNKKSVAREYLEYLYQEIEQLGRLYGNKRPVTQLHFGGGTPTFLDHAELTELIHHLATHFHLGDISHREYSIEIDPRTVDEQTLALLKGLGFNRLSLGVQDTNEKVQQAVNRIQPKEMVEHLVNTARGLNFKSISFDLIYGLPYQTAETMAETVESILTMQPDRISCYNYAHLPERFSSQRAIDRLTLPSAAEKLLMLETISKQFEEAGYLYIGMDHFVKPKDELALAQNMGYLQRNFQGYSTCLAPDTIGIGVSAISSVGNCYIQNEKELANYYAKLDQGLLPVAKGLQLNQDDLIRKAAIMSLICHLHLDLAEIDAKFGIESKRYFRPELDRLKPMVDDGLVNIMAGQILVTETGRRFIRNICMIFDAYLPKNGSSTQIGYSRTL